jgi:hypothetical protein
LFGVSVLLVFELFLVAESSEPRVSVFNWFSVTVVISAILVIIGRGPQKAMV